LTPAGTDSGMHAIAAILSTNPSVPSCYYEPNDYTWVKDSVAMWWDANAPNSGGTVGCYRMSEGGRRYIPGSWPAGDVLSMKGPNDPCSTFVGDGTF
jgi:hypothetical protein